MPGGMLGDILLGQSLSEIEQASTVSLSSAAVAGVATMTAGMGLGRHLSATASGHAAMLAAALRTHQLQANIAGRSAMTSSVSKSDTLSMTAHGTSTVFVSFPSPVTLPGAVINGSSSMSVALRSALHLSVRISGRASAASKLTILRHRALVMAVNGGAYADKTFSTTLTAASGPGIRQIGALQEQIRQQTANYV